VFNVILTDAISNLLWFLIKKLKF